MKTEVEGPNGLFLSTDPGMDKLERLMPFQVKRILLVASLYDCFVLEEDGRLKELLTQSYHRWNLDYVPHLVRIVGNQTALERIQAEKFDLVVSMVRPGEREPFALGREMKRIDPDLPVVMLAYHTPDLKRFSTAADRESVEQIFTWQGDARILLGIIQYIEDRKNAFSDTRLAGVQNILLVDDSIEFYSSYLPVLFDALKEAVLSSLKEGLSDAQRALRQKARPRIHLATSYQEASDVFGRFKQNLLGVIVDPEFPESPPHPKNSGTDFVRSVISEFPHLPVLIQSRSEEARDFAVHQRLGYLSKDSPILTDGLKHFLDRSLGFGAIVLADPDGAAVKIANVNQLYSVIADVPESALRASLQKGEIGRWLRARTEFDLADQVERISGIGSDPDVPLGKRIKEAMSQMRRQRSHGSIVPYSRYFQQEQAQFSLIGSGSIGGKARGLAFMDRIFLHLFPFESFPGVAVSIPRTVVIGTDIFDEFMKANSLLSFAVEDHSDNHILSAFIKATLPPQVLGDLRDLTTHVKVPLAVRSSSLLEDSLYQPFAGIYSTKMLPNDQFDDDVRFLNLVNAIKFVYASTFFREAKSYVRNTPHRIEDEKMAVIIQTVVGQLHRNRFYPDFSGVARSFNYYPAGMAKPEDGVANIAVGLGKTVVDGGTSLHFSPKYPAVLPQFTSVKDMLNLSQKEFYAIAMNHVASVAFHDENQYLVQLKLEDAEKDDVLPYLASVYSPADDMVFDGLTRKGPRIINFAHILKNDVFPLAPILTELLNLSHEAMGNPVEIEFAATLTPETVFPAQFSVLQIRPMVVYDEWAPIDWNEEQKKASLCFSDQVLGNGRIENITDIVLVKRVGFDMAQTPEIADEIGKINARLRGENRSYLLIGPGRWGSSDPWLGIPVKWNQISNAKVIIEAHLEGMHIDLSQGAHFFQNLTSLGIGYFSVPASGQRGAVDWQWLESTKAEVQTRHIVHIRLKAPLLVQMDGRRSLGIIFKPDGEIAG